MTEKNGPQRTCVGCRKVKDKKDLIRIVHTPEGAFHADPGGKANGRGAYICADPVCLELALSKGSLAHSFRCRIPQEAMEQLREELKNIDR